MSKDLAQAESNTPQLLEASTSFGSGVGTGFTMAKDGRLDGKDIGPFINFALSNIEGFKGLGIAFGSELTGATEPDLIQAKANFKQALGPDLTNQQKYTTTEGYSGIICLLNLFRGQAIAEGKALGRAELIAEMQAGTVTFDAVVSGRVK